MQPKPIGILGGAGPLAGASLLKRVFYLANSTFGCYKDEDFPQVFLLSYPFSDMLSSTRDPAVIRKELKKCLNQLRQNGATVLAIACNTLHTFLDKEEDLKDLIHLPQILAAEISKAVKPLVLCTSTSRQSGLHQQFFPCLYPDLDTQGQVDTLIEQILKGAKQEFVVRDLLTILKAQSAETVLLGCTEFSLFTSQLLSCNKVIIDPLEILANKILEKSFLK